MKASEVLWKAHDLLSTKNFTKEAYARDAVGNEVGALDPEAVCFCGIGALAVTMGVTTWRVEQNQWLKRTPLSYLNSACGATSWVGFNDAKTTDKRDVLRKFRKAARMAEKAGN